MPFAIVRASTTDASAIADVWLRSRKGAGDAIPPAVHDDDDVRQYFAERVLPSMETVVAVDDDHGIVGLLVLEGDVVDHLYVDPAHQSRGAGSALLDHAKRRHPNGLQLWTFQSNTPARQFYERRGFVAVRMTDGDNEEGAPDVLYRWTPAADD